MPVKLNSEEKKLGLDDIEEYECPICGKKFIPTPDWTLSRYYSPGDHPRYRWRLVYFCSLRCFEQHIPYTKHHEIMKRCEKL